VPGTVIEDRVGYDEHFSLDDNDGLVPYSDEDDSEGDKDKGPRAGFQTKVWKPAKGNVGLLTYDVVKALSAHTGCTFSIDSHRNEVRLHGGDVSDAVSRLSVMEALLVSLWYV
jgi:hypothetical protein